MRWRPVVTMVTVVVTPVTAGKVPMVVVEHQRGGRRGGSLSLSQYACSVAIPRARTKYLTLTIGETHAQVPLPGLLADSKTSAPPVICIPLTSHCVCVILSLSLSFYTHTHTHTHTLLLPPLFLLPLSRLHSLFTLLAPFRLFDPFLLPHI